eukprot:PITA_18531
METQRFAAIAAQMEAESFTQLFTVDQEIAAFLVSCGILSKAWEESLLASGSESFSLNEYEGVVYVAFPSFHKIEGFIVEESIYGEGIIQTDNKVFSGCLKGNDAQPALVHLGALKLFLHVMENTDFQAKMQIYTDSKQRQLKPIIFVGHSLGGAVATLATLWVLEKRLRQSSPLCITFGSPLVGDVGLVEAVGHENWAGNFCHVVSKHDIVPRMLLATFDSIAEPLIAILPYWQSIMTNDSKTVPDSSIQDACRTLLKNVLQDTHIVTNYGPDSLRESDGAIKRSPYKPFGTYMFCSVEGAACIDNSETVLKILHLTMQSHEKPYDNIVQDCFKEHVEYGSVLKHVIEKSISGKRSAKCDSESSYKMGISLQLEAIGIGAQDDHAQIALQIARNMENRHSSNVAKLAIELSEKQCIMAEIEWYKERCEKEDGITYYDSFRKHNHIDANLRRQSLAKFWDDIIKMWENHELPHDFQSQNKWINAGTAYRRLVEPLDIAHYYGMSNGKGNYLSDGRPTRHKVLEKWMEEKEKTRSSKGRSGRTELASLTQDSCFWAHVEEALKELKNLEQSQNQKLESLEIFEGYVARLINDRNISFDVFLQGSSFMEWWKEWKKFKQDQFTESSSPLYEIMETESWKEGLNL